MVKKKRVSSIGYPYNTTLRELEKNHGVLTATYGGNGRLYIKHPEINNKQNSSTYSYE